MAPLELHAWTMQMRVLEDMLIDRGYHRIKLALTGTDPCCLCVATDARQECLRVYITEETKVGVKTLRKLKDECRRTKCDRLLLLCPSGLTPFAAKELSAEESGPHLEVFKKNELAFNVTRHSLVPAHTPLSQGEKRKLCARLNFKPANFPKIKETDPVIKYHGLPPGTMERYMGTLEGETSYRIVVP
jgi:DNA-directed RNA polymerase subunit H (RpoH/RPB5)